MAGPDDASSAPDADWGLDPFPRYAAHDPLSRAGERRQIVRSGASLLRVSGQPERLPRLALARLPPQELPPQPPAEDVQPATTFIEIELLDTEDKPVAGEEYRIELPDGSTRSGRLNRVGRAYLDGLEPGTCQVSFPNLHGEDWRRA